MLESDCFPQQVEAWAGPLQRRSTGEARPVKGTIVTRQPDFRAYHQSIAYELVATKDRIRNLIGDAHWLTDGEHKEAVLRRTIRDHIAGDLQVGRGFVCGEQGSSRQIDVLIACRSKPVLFQDGELLLVTPDAVAAIIEVKTALPSDPSDVLAKLADDVEMVRNGGNLMCQAGLFVYEPYRGGRNAHEHLLRQLREAAEGERNRVVNWVAAGPDLFFRYWKTPESVSSPARGPVWHSYELPELSHAYFVSNVVWTTCEHPEQDMQFAWFPLEGGKERLRKWYVELDGSQPIAFNP